jgi:hypothetical protein
VRPSLTRGLSTADSTLLGRSGRKKINGGSSDDLDAPVTDRVVARDDCPRRRQERDHEVLNATVIGPDRLIPALGGRIDAGRLREERSASRFAGEPGEAKEDSTVPDRMKSVAPVLARQGGTYGARR